MVQSINPFNSQVLATYPKYNDIDVSDIVNSCAKAHQSWKFANHSTRAELFKRLAEELHEQIHELAELCTLEMGKPISQSYAEIEKCAWLCDYYAGFAADMLADEDVDVGATFSGIHNQSLGVILGIMPWNFPFWQVFRFAIPTLAAGNTVLLKLASNVSGCALAIEKLFHAISAPENIFRTVIADATQVEKMIANPLIKGVSFTGSDIAGSQVASLAGKHLKPSVLELGGSNPCIILEDARFDQAVAGIIAGRFQNAGQSCIAAKRILIQESVAEKYIERLEALIRSMRTGNPMEPDMEIGPLAKPEFAQVLYEQMTKSIQMGAKLLCGGNVESAFFKPALMIDVTPGMPVFDDETFGPLCPITTFKDLDQAISLCNNSRYGLGTSIFTANPDRIMERIEEFEQSSLFFNSIVKSDPRLPFGGIKDSGYGRELGKDGLLAFVNRQTFVAY
jgi:succinate-semialdehyde dehydrogenase/glutarate-semialdehyde dehydrogenase